MMSKVAGRHGAPGRTDERPSPFLLRFGVFIESDRLDFSDTKKTAVDRETTDDE